MCTLMKKNPGIAWHASTFVITVRCQLYIFCQGAVLLTVGRSYVGNDVTRSTLLDGAGACSYENMPR